MRLIALIVFGVMSIVPASAQYYLRPSGAVHMLDGCDGTSGYPDCHPDRTYMGPAAAGGTVRGGMPPASQRQVKPTYR